MKQSRFTRGAFIQLFLGGVDVRVGRSRIVLKKIDFEHCNFAFVLLLNESDFYKFLFLVWLVVCFTNSNAVVLW